MKYIIPFFEVTSLFLLGHIILTHTISEKQIVEVLSNFESGDRIFLQNEINNVDKIISAASEKGMEIVFNPSPFGAEILSYPLDKIDWFIVNETEAHELTKESDPDKILSVFSEKYPSANVLLTLGSDGSLCRADGKTYRQEIFNVPVADTTAAGDTFLGFFFALLDDLGIADALRYASAASAVAVSQNGASSSIPKLSEVKDFLNKQ